MTALGSLIAQLTDLRIAHDMSHTPFCDCASWRDDFEAKYKQLDAAIRQFCDSLVAELERRKSGDVSPTYCHAVNHCIAIVRKRFYGDVEAESGISASHSSASGPKGDNLASPPLSAEARHYLVNGMLQSCEELGDLEDCMSAALAYLETQLNISIKEWYLISGCLWPGVQLLSDPDLRKTRRFCVALINAGSKPVNYPNIYSR